MKFYRFPYTVLDIYGGTFPARLLVVVFKFQAAPSSPSVLGGPPQIACVGLPPCPSRPPLPSWVLVVTVAGPGGPGSLAAD